MASVRRCQALPLCPMESVPLSSNKDLLLSTAEPIGDSGRASGITDLKMDKKPCATAAETE